MRWQCKTAVRRVVSGVWGVSSICAPYCVNFGNYITPLCFSFLSRKTEGKIGY